MHLRVNPADELPIYRQIMRQIVDAIAGGQLPPAAQLPSHRELSEQLVIAPLTVKKAYDELESAGWIEQARGRGTFVRDTLPRVAPADRAARVEDAARALLRQAYLAELDFHDVVALLEVIDHERTIGPPTSNRP